MTELDHNAAYRILRFSRKEKRPKKYRHSLQAVDDRTGDVHAVCDLAGQTAFATTEITDGDGGVWVLKPNRKVMPSRWPLAGPHGATVFEFDQKIAKKLMNPWGRIILALRDGGGADRYTLLLPREPILDRVFGVPLGDYALMEQDTVRGRLTSLKAREADRPRPKGLLSRLRSAIPAPSDRAFVSNGPEHVLPAPAVLAMYALSEELLDTSGG